MDGHLPLAWDVWWPHPQLVKCPFWSQAWQGMQLADMIVIGIAVCKYCQDQPPSPRSAKIGVIVGQQGAVARVSKRLMRVKAWEQCRKLSHWLLLPSAKRDGCHERARDGLSESKFIYRLRHMTRSSYELYTSKGRNGMCTDSHFCFWPSRGFHTRCLFSQQAHQGLLGAHMTCLIAKVAWQVPTVSWFVTDGTFQEHLFYVSKGILCSTQQKWPFTQVCPSLDHWTCFWSLHQPHCCLEVSKYLVLLLSLNDKMKLFNSMSSIFTP